jgi:GTP cyclohydrolase IA
MVNQDTARIEAAVVELLLAIGEDPRRSELRQTPRRVAESYAEFFAGIGVDPVAELLSSCIDAQSSELGEVVLLRDIHFRSVCEHHLLPFTGVAHVAYLPGERIVGLGALARVVETIAARPQLQERLTEQVADALDAALDPRGVLVVLDATHGCVTARGPRQEASSTVTMATRGALATAAERAELVALIGAPRG